MRAFHHKGALIALHSVAGRVLAANRNSSTEYAIRGGDGFVPREGGYVAPPQLESHTSTSTDFWLELPAGVNRHFVLDGVSIPLLAGQQVAIVLGTTDGAIADVPVGVLNLTSNMWYGLTSSGGLLWYVDTPSKTMSVYVTWIIGFLIAALAFVATVAMNQPGWSVMLIVATVVLGYVYAKATQVIFALRIQRARDRMLAQANEDCRHHLGAAVA